jgi:hypothetical protein
LGGINSLNDVRYNWTLMSAKLNGRPVLQWTDGSRNSDGSLRWFDQAASYYPRGHADYWQVDPIDPLHKVGRTAVDQDRRPEVNMPEFGPYGDYMALWTFAKSDNWPKALRLCLTAGDNPPKSLEIIVPLPD